MSFMSVAAAMALAASAAGPQAAAPCAQALCGTDSLAPYFAALEQTRLGVARTVHVLQIGDSHSAGDAITGPWRDALQAKFGVGGRGVMPPGRPFEGFFPHGVHVDQSPGWTVESTFRADANALPLFGISGFRLTSHQDGASLTLTAEPAQAFRRLVVCAEAKPQAGSYAVTIGAVTTPVSLDAPTTAVTCSTFPAEGLQTQAVLTTQGAPVTLTSWASFNDAGGVVVSNLGVVGVTLKHFMRADSQAVGEELKAYRPDLIVLAFGTNDGFVGHLNAAAFEDDLRSQVKRLQRLGGGVPILILGAPDAESKRGALAHNDDTGGPALPEDPPSPGPQPYAQAFRSTWFSPPALAQIRQIQRRVAQEMGVAFWDWGARMGGPGAADRWATATPPLTRGDRVHTTSAGGARVAAMLQADLGEAYSAYQATH
jgi:lysophospholipase L1-like esterase